MIYLTQLILNYLRGFLMKEFVARIIGAFFTKEKIIGMVAGVIISGVAAGIDMQPQVMRDAICSAYAGK